jgi:hypothetical protein
MKSSRISNRRLGADASTQECDPQPNRRSFLAVVIGTVLSAIMPRKSGAAIHTEVTNPTIEERVRTLRQRLARARDEQAVQDSTEAGGEASRIAQWGNWSNSWNNMPGWRNF